MRFGKLMKSLKKSSKTPAEYMEEDELASPYEDMDFNKMAQAMEKGVSPEELSDIAKKKRKMKEMAERLRMKQER
jgi:hypothetical protein